MKRISVIGLGKLGAPMLAVFCEAGFDVVGVDTNPEYVAQINVARAPVIEPDLQNMLTKHRAKYYATASTREAVFASEATFIIVPTPTGDDGGFVLDYVTPCCEDIGAALREKQGYHLVVVTSTVMPGHMRDICATLEAASGKQHGADFGLCYSPEFIALGSVIHDSLHPDYALVGEEDTRAGDALAAIYHLVHDAPVVRMNWVNAEITKIAQNSFITQKITFANQLSMLCGHIPGANVDDVSRALGHDRRVGKHYLKGGTAFGGPCFPRDSRAFNRAARNAGTALPMAVLTDRLNHQMIDELRHTITLHAQPGQVVGILGLAYKPGTPVVEESASLILIRQLLPAYTVVVYDALALDEARKSLPVGVGVEYAQTAGACVRCADVVVLMLGDYNLVKNLLFRDRVLIDPWRVMLPYTFACKRYVPLGVGAIEQAETERRTV